jgi:hypothetical protein
MVSLDGNMGFFQNVSPGFFCKNNFRLPLHLTSQTVLDFGGFFVKIGSSSFHSSALCVPRAESIFFIENQTTKTSVTFQNP